MAQVPDKVLEHYDEVPRHCFVAGVPFYIRYHPDNVILPSGLTIANPSGGFGKWLKFSSFGAFVQVCRSYWFDALDPSTLSSLHVFVMPYTPLEDAHALHSTILHPRALPQDPYEAFGSTHEPMDLDKGQGEAGVQLKEAELPITDGVSLSYTVVNYGLLWSKSHKFCLLQHVANPLCELMHRVVICDTILNQRRSTTRTTSDLDAKADEARKHLAIELIEEYGIGTLGVNPHDALESMYPDLHDHIYQDDCHYCYPRVESLNQEDSPAVLEGLQGALSDLGYQDYDNDITIEQAELNLLMAEGDVEYHMTELNALSEFSKVRVQLEGVVQPMLNYLRSITTNDTLIGAVVDEEDGGN